MHLNFRTRLKWGENYTLDRFTVPRMVIEERNIRAEQGKLSGEE
jgi:hypothetical protein